MRNSLTLLLGCITLIAHAQLQRNYTSYTVDNGLAQNTVWDAFQDHKGFMWFGTADGINRFDGYKMYHYKWNSHDSSTLLGNTAFKFYEDSDNTLWISHNRGVSIYHREKDCFSNIDLNTGIGSVIGERYATVLGEDRRGRVWSISVSNELVAISKRNFVVQKRMMVSTSKFNLSSIRTCVNTDKYIIGYLNDSSTTWFRLNTENDKVDIINGPTNLTGYFFRYNDSTICAFDKNNIYLYYINQNKFEAKKIGSEEITRSLSSLIATSLAWWQGKIYLGNNTGLYVFNPDKMKFEERITTFNKGERVGFYYVQFLRVDRSGNLWICTNGDGVKCLSPYRNKFKHYNSPESRNRLVKSITTDAAQNIYTGLYAEGIITYKKNGSLEQYKFGKSTDELSHVLAQTFWNNRYFVVNDRLLKELDPKTKKEISRVNVFHYKNNGYCAYPFFCHYKNKLYLSCDVAIYEIPEKGRAKLVFKNNGLDTIITTFAVLNDTTWWIGTTKFVYKYNPVNGKTKGLPIDVYTKTLCVASDKKTVWIGGNVGVYLMSVQGTLIRKFDISDGLPDDFIYGILEDRHGRFWMSHNKGMSVYDPHTKIFKHYGVKDGLQSNEFNTGAYHKDEKRMLYFGGVNGVNIIDPDNITENKNRPQIAINEVLVDDLPHRFDTAYNELHTITLSYLQNTLSFDFSALEFSDPENNTYRYKMEGYDNNWIESGTKHFARYANLPPGNYTLKIKAANGDGFWNETPREVFINITPPYWQTMWFYVMEVVFALLLIGSAVYVFFKRQGNRLKRELEVQHKLEQERLRISRDLHDNVGAQLSYLITNMEWIQNNPDKINATETTERMQSLTDAGRNAILTLRQTIWAISHTELSVDDFADRFKQYALKLVEFDQRIKIHFDEDFIIPKTLSPAQALNVFRICQEALNNCLKHAHCANVYITFRSSYDFLFKFIIRDDGIGFDWDAGKRKGHYGLVNMEARVKESGAILEVISAVNAGTTITITVK